MIIAIQGHHTRGKEVIKILESLGGENTRRFFGNSKNYYYFINEYKVIDRILRYNSLDGYKCYTLEEFETKFPFKIRDTVINNKGDEGFITDLITMNGEILYSVKYNYNQFGIVSPNLLKLKKKEMNTRNITLTLDKAKEWYKQGGELKEIALQAFTEQELNPLPKSWEEFVEKHGIYDLRYMFNGNCPQKYIALWKLEQLRDYYRQGWKPNWTSDYVDKYCITISANKLMVATRSTGVKFLAFQSREVAEEFLKNFEHLIKEAGDLI